MTFLPRILAAATKSAATLIARLGELKELHDQVRKAELSTQRSPRPNR